MGKLEFILIAITETHFLKDFFKSGEMTEQRRTLAALLENPSPAFAAT